MDNLSPSPRLQKALREAFTYPAPDDTFLTGLEQQLQRKLVSPSHRSWLENVRGRLQPAWSNFSHPVIAVAAMLFLIIAIGFSIRLLPTTAPGKPQYGPGAIPTPHSPLIESFIWQTDGKFGYRMLRPAGWNAVDEDLDRLYLPAGSEGQADRVNLEVLNLKVIADRNVTSSGAIAQWLLFQKAPTLEGWTLGLEQSWPSTGVQFRLEQTLPNAKIYLLKMSSSPDSTLLVGAVVSQDQPLLVGMNTYGAYSGEEYVRSSRLLEDFVTMVSSLSVVAPGPNLSDPPLDDKTPAGEHSATPSLVPTAEPVSVAPTAIPVPDLIPGMFALQYYPPLVMEYDPEAWMDKSEPGNKQAYVNFLQSKELGSCTIGVNLPSGWGDYPHETVQLGHVNYTVYTFGDSPSSPGQITAIYFANQLVGADYRIGIPMPMISASNAEWNRCKMLGEVVLATLRADMNREPPWRQYEFALASAMLGPDTYPSRTLGSGLCEWTIAGATQEDVYVFALCQDATSDQGTAVSAPVVIHLQPDGTIGTVVMPQDGTDYYPSIQAMFPSELWEKALDNSTWFNYDPQQRIAYRRTHLDVPPKIVEDGVALPPLAQEALTPTSIPTGPAPTRTPDPDFPAEIYPAPLPFQNPVNGLIANGCPDLDGVQRGEYPSMDTVIDVLAQLGSGDWQQFRQASDQAYWPLTVPALSVVKLPRPEELQISPAATSSYSGLIENGCGQQTLDLSWYVRRCVEDCSNPQRFIALDTHFYLINRKGHWLVWVAY